MGFDISALSAYTEERASEFYSKALLGSKVAQQMTVIDGIKSAVKLPTEEFGYDIFQSDNDCTFVDGNNDLVIAQRTLTPVDIMINETFCVKKLEPYFTQKILKPGGVYEDVPAELKLFNMIGMSVQKALELALVRGVLGGASAIASFNLFNGMIETASNDIAAGDIPAAQQLTGSLAQANIIASFRAMVDAMDLDSTMNMGSQNDWKIYCSPQAKKNYDRAYQAANGALPYNTTFDKNYLDNTGVEIVDLAGFAEDDTQAILTRAGNYWMGVDVEGEETDLSLALGAGTEAKTLYLSGVFKMGIQTKFPETMVTNNIS
jgi:hypothetical protein